MRGGFMKRMGVENRDEDYKLSRVNKDILKLLFKYLYPYKGEITVAFLAMLLVTGTALLGPYLFKIAIDTYIIPGNLLGVFYIFIAIVITYGINWISSYWQGYISSRVGQGIIKDVRSDLYRHILNMSGDFFARENTGEIMSRITNDTETLSDLVSTGIIYFVNDILTLSGILIILFNLNLKLTLVTMITLPLVFILFNILGKKMREAYQEVRIKMARLNAGVEENISGIKVVQSLSREKDNVGRFIQYSRENWKANLRAVSIFAFFFPAMNLTGVLGTGLVLWTGGLQVMKGEISLGILTAFLGYISRFFFPLRDLSQVYNTYQSAAAGLERIKEYFDQDSYIKEVPNPVKFSLSNGSKKKGVDININNLYFSYSNTTRMVLNNINLNIKDGEVVAIVGPSGAGKTTLARLLTRLYDPVKGEIRFNDIDIRHLSFKDLRSIITMVPQNVYLFPGSIWENIAFGKPGASREDIINAAKQVYAHEFINKLPEKYETEVGEEGTKLSGGQKQLISFARAILADPEILILDEATSSVDAYTEGLIQSAMNNLFKGRTVVIIAHRFVTLKDVDRIILMDKGSIQARGKHEELISTSSLYRNLYLIQKGTHN